ncbi:MAG: Ig-like domain-containing protein, partial [Clostridiales bacterium]|nr:Ig-like domain-containing protein [Clostridiales bacterium]
VNDGDTLTDVDTAFVVPCDTANTIKLDVDDVDASAADFDWTITSGKEYATLDADDDDNGVQENEATFTPNMIVKDYQTVDVAVTMTSKLNPATKATKTITAYITKEVNVLAANKIAINEAADGTIALSTGDTKQLTSIVYSNQPTEDGESFLPATVQDVIWSTPDTDVISVDANGLVKAIAASEDEVTVTATSKEKQDLIAEVNFKVSDIAAESIALSESTVSLEAGAAKNVTVEVKGANDKAATNQAVTVASNNEAVATAKAADGKITVTGVAAGTANIVVTSVANKDVTVTIPVTVTAAPVAPTNPTEVAVSAITLSQSSALLSAGKTVALAATVAPENATNKAVTWTSSDASVATVDANGVVTAVSAGKATITATAGTVSATCDVTVSSVKLNAKTVPLQVKKSTSALKATVSAKEDAVVSWKSSNTKVVKVNAKTGKLTATSKTGTAKITVTTKSGAKATCTVKVQKARVTTKSIAFAKKSVSLKKGKSVKLTINRNPISATEKITWTSSNKKVATVDKNGKVTGKKAGKVTITAKTSNGKKATCKVTVK